MMTGIVKYVGDETGASAAEYALILGFIALVIIISLTTFGANLNALFGNEAATFSTL